ncbi:RNA recognition motif 2-domain-containing protein [Apiospora arundinis]|uniref:RNA recognition motif 2-domain-containing protein n=1 Tax=Apiospora arundinis TaxID=335852 RepID=A0ABR2HL18_9PEZI
MQSPRSSSGAADSFNGTPDTRLTTFSPDDGISRSVRAPHSIGLGLRDARGTIVAASPASLDSRRRYRDPFVSSYSLSPTASSFSPQSSTPVPPTTGPPTVIAAKAADDFIHQELSTDSGVSRCLVIYVQGGGTIHKVEVDNYLSILANRDFNLSGSNQIETRNNVVYARFSNIRDACIFHQNAQLGGKGWVAIYINPRDFYQAVNPTGGIITAHEGQVALAVFAPPSLVGTNPLALYEMLQQKLQNEGDLFAFKMQATGVEGSVFNAIVEYCENDVSLQAVSKLHLHNTEQGYQICMTLYRPDIPAPVPALRNGSPSDLANDLQRLSITRPQVQAPLGMVPMVYPANPYLLDQYQQVWATRGSIGMPRAMDSYSGLSQYARLPDTFHRPGEGFPRGIDSRRQHAIRIQRAPYHHGNTSGQHNHVDISRIREGIDVRTTIMLRNIPNKVDQAMLKRIVDESSWGKYDFMYLRIDFANDCNVGYAFINFVDPLDIIDFVRARGNQRWNCFKSDKVAEISYATIQGKDCLVQKFRNSSVMLEAAHYRPKLYFTINGPAPAQAGEEEPFPAPDNHSKMKRSCENAEHVGLFTPNAGQHYRDEQRRRRSQYDRGTRLAALEEFDYDTSYPPYAQFPPQ